MSKNRPSLKEKQAGTEAGVNELNLDMNDFFAIDPQLKKEIEGKGLAYRWVNAIKLKANYGYDSRQWQPYKRETQGTGMTSFSDPEGYIRRGDLILAVQPKGVAQARRKQLDARNQAQSQARFAKTQAEELRQTMRKSGMDVDIVEGYDEKDEG